MSVDATQATWKLKNISAIQKLLLLSLADRADELGCCWPSVKRLQADTLLNRKTIIENRQILLDQKLISYTGRYKGRQRQIPVMKLMYVQHREGEIDIDNDHFFTGTENGTGKSFTSTENGTGTSTENGTLNLTIEPINNTTTSISNFLEKNREKEIEGLQMAMDISEEKRKVAKFKHESLTDPECIRVFNERFQGTNVKFETLYEDVVDYWSQKDQFAYKARFLTHLRKVKIEKYLAETVPDNSNRPKGLASLAEYTVFINEIKAMKKFNEIPSDIYIPSFEECKIKGIIMDAKAFKKELNL